MESKRDKDKDTLLGIWKKHAGPYRDQLRHFAILCVADDEKRAKDKEMNKLKSNRILADKLRDVYYPRFSNIELFYKETYSEASEFLDSISPDKLHKMRGDLTRIVEDCDYRVFLSTIGRSYDRYKSAQVGKKSRFAIDPDNVSRKLSYTKKAH